MHNLLLTVLISLFPMTYCYKSRSNLCKELNSLVFSSRDLRPGATCKTWTLVASHKSNVLIEDSTCGQNTFGGSEIRQAYLQFTFHSSWKQTNGSGEHFFDKTYTDEEILHPGYPGPLLHSPQCQLVLLHSFESDFKGLEDLTRTVVAGRISRPHKDYFLYISNPVANALFSKTKFAGEIRHKFYFSQSANSTPDFNDACTRSNINPSEFKLNPRSFSESVSLFRRDCKDGLAGSHLVISSVLGTPWLQFTADANQKPIGNDITGIYYTLFKDSALKFNFTFELQYANTGGSSGFKKNGRWYGVVGEVYNREADIGWGTGITPFRHLVVDNSVSTEELSRIFFIRAPSLTRTWRAIFSPLHRDLWLLIIGTAFLLIPCCYLALHFELLNSVFPVHSSMEAYMIREVVTSVMAIWTEQSASTKPWIGFRIKCLMFLWMLSCLVITSGYRSRLVSSLTFNTPKEVPLTHAALIQENFRLLFRYYGGVAYNFAKLSNDPMQHEIIARSILINSSQECVREIIRGENVACLDWDVHGGYAVTTNSTVSERQERDLIIKSKDSVVSCLQIAWIFRKLSPITETFNSYIGRIWSSGISNKWSSEDWAHSKSKAAKWVKQNPNEPGNKKALEVYAELTGTTKVLGLSSFYGLFAILGIGELFGVIIWLLENLTTLRLTKRSVPVISHSFQAMRCITLWRFIFGEGLLILRCGNGRINQSHKLMKRCHLRASTSTSVELHTEFTKNSFQLRDKNSDLKFSHKMYRDS